MATLPRSSRYPPGPPSVLLQRPVSEFDSGLNTSTAWTEHLVTGTSSSNSQSRTRGLRQHQSESDARHTLSEDEGDYEPELVTRPARALYPFEGKPEFRELTVKAGDELDVVKEDVGDGWSLVRDVAGEIGLLPQTYYTLTVDFSLSPDIQLDVTRKREASGSSITPRASPRSSQAESSLAALLPQHTGEWLPTFPSFRQSLLGGKSINRFSSFVTSGAESYLLNGSILPPQPDHPKSDVKHSKDASTASRLDALEEERANLNFLGLGEADRHIIDAGPAGPVWHPKTPPFTVLVHSPTKNTDSLTGAYTLYSVTSIFPASPTPAGDWIEVVDPDDTHPPSPTTNGEATTRITVQRRFSQFVMLHTCLSRRLPGIVLPPLPEKQYAGRFNEDFVEARRGDLERYLNKIVRHPIVRYTEVVIFFLGCDNDAEWTRLLPQHLSAPAAGPSFYARVYHPAFNVDVEDAEDAIKSFRRHTRAVGKGIQGLRSVFGRVREARVEMSKAERLLSYSLLSLITSTPMASAPTPPGTTTDDEEGEGSSSHGAEKAGDKRKGLVNKDGAWCWREGCSECLRLAKAVQKTCETLQTVANLYDGHARRTQLATHESLKLMAHPSSIYESVTTTHKSTLTRYREALGSGEHVGPTYADENMVARCETVLNTTMAEMDVYHTQKGEDLKAVAVDHLDGEIAFYEQILTRLKSARAMYDNPQYKNLDSSPRLPSIYEKDFVYDPSKQNGPGLQNSHLAPRPLPQPCPHVFDSAPMRPVSVAIQEGVGMFLGDSYGTRGSVFGKGKFW